MNLTMWGSTRSVNESHDMSASSAWCKGRGLGKVRGVGEVREG